MEVYLLSFFLFTKAFSSLCYRFFFFPVRFHGYFLTFVPDRNCTKSNTHEKKLIPICLVGHFDPFSFG